MDQRTHQGEALAAEWTWVVYEKMSYYSQHHFLKAALTWRLFPWLSIVCHRSLESVRSETLQRCCLLLVRGFSPRPFMLKHTSFLRYGAAVNDKGRLQQIFGTIRGAEGAIWGWCGAEVFNQCIWDLHLHLEQEREHLHICQHALLLGVELLFSPYWLSHLSRFLSVFLSPSFPPA